MKRAIILTGDRTVAARRVKTLYEALLIGLAKAEKPRERKEAVTEARLRAGVLRAFGAITRDSDPEPLIDPRTGQPATQNGEAMTMVPKVALEPVRVLRDDVALPAAIVLTPDQMKLLIAKVEDAVIEFRPSVLEDALDALDFAGGFTDKEWPDDATPESVVASLTPKPVEDKALEPATV